MRGVTYIEILIVVAIIVLLAGTTLPAYRVFVTSNVLSSVRYETTQNMHLAQTKAINQENNSSFGLYFESNQYTFFQGNSYAARNSTYDRIMTIATNIVLSGMSEIVFNQKTGFPDSTGTLTITNISSGESETISINSAGLIY